MEQDEALLMRLAMHFERVRDKIGHVAVLSEALTTQEAQRAREAVVGGRAQVEAGLVGCGGHVWTTDVAQIAEHVCGVQLGGHCVAICKSPDRDQQRRRGQGGEG